MQRQDGPRRGDFSWHLTRDGVSLDHNAAPDGEEYFAAPLALSSAALAPRRLARRVARLASAEIVTPARSA